MSLNTTAAAGADERRPLRPSLVNTRYESFSESSHELSISDEKESWHSPPEIRPKLRVSCLGFLLLGLHDASVVSLEGTGNEASGVACVGTCIALITGLSVAATVTPRLLRKIGIRGVLTLGPLLLFCSYSSLFLNPQQHTVQLLSRCISSFGYAFINLCFLTWIGSFQDAFLSLTIVHSWYYAGGALGVALAATLEYIDHQSTTFYFVMSLIAGLYFVLVSIVFKDETAQMYAFRTSYNSGMSHYSILKQMVKSGPVWWIGGIFFIISNVQLLLPLGLLFFASSDLQSIEVALGLPRLLQFAFWFGLVVGSSTSSKTFWLFPSTYRFVLTYLLCALVPCCLLANEVFELEEEASVEVVAGLLFLLGVFLSPVKAAALANIAAAMPGPLYITSSLAIVSIGQICALAFPLVAGLVFNGVSASLLAFFALSLFLFVIVSWNFCRVY